MKIGVTTSVYFRVDGAGEGFRKMKAHGFDCADFSDLSDTDNALNTLSDAEFEKKLIYDRDAAQAAGIEIYQSHGPWRWPPRDFEPADRLERFEKMSRALWATRLLGCKYMVIHPIMPFGWESDPHPEAFHEMNLDYYTRLCKVAEKENVTICLENMPMPGISLASPAQIRAFVEEVGSANLKVCLDTGHALITHYDKPAASCAANGVYETGKALLRTLHVHDNPGSRDMHMLPFTGACDWNAFCKALKDVGFDGPLSSEVDLHIAALPERLRDENRLLLAHTMRHLADKIENF